MVLSVELNTNYVNYWSNGAPKSCEILKFVCVPKDVKHCCDTTKLNCSHCAGCCRGLHNEYDQVLWLHGIFLETNIHQNLARHRDPIAELI